jgi:tetratricopeptide (TPR) repeat protein
MGRDEEPHAASGLIERAEVLIDLGRDAEAVPLLRQAAAQAPDDAEPHGWLALALHHLGRNREALQCADAGVARSPDWEWPHRLRGIILLALGKRREALEAAAASVRLDPSGRDPLHLLATCHLELRRYPEALRTAERLRESAPDWDFTHNLFAAVAGHQRRWRDCETHCRAALELNPESRSALLNLGNALRQSGRKREASACYHRVLVLDPADAEARRALLTLVSWDMAELPIWKRRERLEEEHPDVQAFVKDAQDRTLRETSSLLVKFWVGLGWVFTLGWTALVIAFASRGGLLHRWWDWAAYLSVTAATLLGTAHLIRIRLKDPR